MSIPKTADVVIVGHRPCRACRTAGSGRAVVLMDTSQPGGRFEVARYLALPRYKGGGHVTGLAGQMVGLEHNAMKEIMYVVSEFNKRSENWMKMMGEEAPDLNEEQVRLIGEIEV